MENCPRPYTESSIFENTARIVFTGASSIPPALRASLSMVLESDGTARAVIFLYLHQGSCVNVPSSYLRHRLGWGFCRLRDHVRLSSLHTHHSLPTEMVVDRWRGGGACVVESSVCVCVGAWLTTTILTYNSHRYMQAGYHTGV